MCSLWQCIHCPYAVLEFSWQLTGLMKLKIKTSSTLTICRGLPAYGGRYWDFAVLAIFQFGLSVFEPKTTSFPVLVTVTVSVLFLYWFSVFGKKLNGFFGLTVLCGLAFFRFLLKKFPLNNLNRVHVVSDCCPDSSLRKICFENLSKTSPRGRKRVVDKTDWRSTLFTQIYSNAVRPSCNKVYHR